jgi:hypothetical protein
MASGKSYESLRDILQRTAPPKKACNRHNRHGSKSHTDASDSDDEENSPSLSLDKLLQLKSASAVGAGGRHHRGGQVSFGSRGSFGSDADSGRHSGHRESDDQSEGSLVDSAPATPKKDKLTGKIHRSFGSDGGKWGGSLVDENAWDDFDQKMSKLVKRQANSKIYVDGGMISYA